MRSRPPHTDLLGASARDRSRARFAAAAPRAATRHRRRRPRGAGAGARRARVSGRAAGCDPALHAGARSAARLAARQPRRRSASSCCPTSATGPRSAGSPAAAIPPISRSCSRSRPMSSSTSAAPHATYVSLAERVQQQTGIPYALLDGRFDKIRRDLPHARRARRSARAAEASRAMPRTR